MFEKLQREPSDDRGVSPVLGVALLIGITVTLVAVVGIVVMGVGPGGTQMPSAQLTFDPVSDEDASTNYDNVTVTHNGGDSLKAENLVVKVNGSTSTPTVSGMEGTISAGDSFEIDLNSSDDSGPETVTIVWQSPSGDKTSVIAEYTV